MKDYLSIKEFSNLTNIEGSTLRYWDEIGLFAPAKRDPENGYRYYTPDQIIAVNFFSVLSKLDIPLRIIREISSDRTPETIVSLIENQEKLLDAEIHRLYERYAVMHVRRKLIKIGLDLAQSDAVSVMNLEDMHFIQGHPADFTPGQKFYGPFLKFCKEAETLRINLQFPIAALHNNWRAFKYAAGEPHYYISIDPEGNQVRPAGKYLVGLTRGYYGNLNEVAARMDQYITDHCLKITGPVFSIYLHDEISLKNPNDYLAFACIAIEQ